MARSYETALAELENKRGELEALSTISEEEVCYVYNALIPQHYNLTLFISS